MEKETAEAIEKLNSKIDYIIGAQYLTSLILKDLIHELNCHVVVSAPIYKERIEEICKELLNASKIEVRLKGEEADE